MSSIHDRIPSLSGTKTATFRADDVRKSQEFRKDYEGTTFRDNLGLVRPPHPNAKQAPQVQSPAA